MLQDIVSPYKDSFAPGISTELRAQRNLTRRVTMISGSLTANQRTDVGGIGARAYQDGVYGFSSAADLSGEAVKRVLQNATDNAQLLAEHPDMQRDIMYVADLFREKRKPLVLALDEEIAKAGLDEKLRSRLESGLIVSLNRMEVGKGGVVTAQKEAQEKYGFPVASIVSMAEVVECLYNKEVEGEVVINDDIKAAIDEYYEQYGVKE